MREELLRPERQLEATALWSEAWPWARLVPDASGQVPLELSQALLTGPRGKSPILTGARLTGKSLRLQESQQKISSQSGRNMTQGFLSQAGSQIVASQRVAFPFLSPMRPAAMMGGA